MSGGHTPEQLSRFEAELRDNAGLVEAVLREHPPVQVERITIRCDAASIDVAIARALALAVEGVEARIELIKQ